MYTKLMIILLHVLTALASMVYTSYLFIAPSKSKFKVAYSLVGLTLLSGTYLVVSRHSPLLQACTTGLVYLGAVSLGIVAAHRKLSQLE